MELKLVNDGLGRAVDRAPRGASERETACAHDWADRPSHFGQGLEGMEVLLVPDRREGVEVCTHRIGGEEGSAGDRGDGRWRVGRRAGMASRMSLRCLVRRFALLALQGDFRRQHWRESRLSRKAPWLRSKQASMRDQLEVSSGNWRAPYVSIPILCSCWRTMHHRVRGAHPRSVRRRRSFEMNRCQMNLEGHCCNSWRSCASGNRQGTECEGLARRRAPPTKLPLRGGDIKESN